MPMTEDELDAIYTRCARTLDALGEARGHAWLARLALVLMLRVDDRVAIEQAMDEAGMADAAGEAAPRADGAATAGA